MEHHSWGTPNPEVLCLLPAYAQSIPFHAYRVFRLKSHPMTYAMTAVTRSLQQAYVRDAMICITVAVLHNTLRLRRPCVQHTAASHLAFHYIEQLFA